MNNLAVALLSQGHLQEVRSQFYVVIFGLSPCQGIQILEDALHASPSTVVVAEPLLFNLGECSWSQRGTVILTTSAATLYELRSIVGADKKRELLIEVAKWAGDGLRTACLKMPTS